MSIAVQDRKSKVDTLKEMVQALGMNSDAVLNHEALVAGNISVQAQESQIIGSLMNQLKTWIRNESKGVLVKHENKVYILQ